jgi:hypothetical protein
MDFHIGGTGLMLGHDYVSCVVRVHGAAERQSFIRTAPLSNVNPGTGNVDWGFTWILLLYSTH